MEKFTKNKNWIQEVENIDFENEYPPPSIPRWTPLNPGRKYVKVARLHLDQYSGRSMHPTMHPSSTMNS